jgi:hypothetical protein
MHRHRELHLSEDPRSVDCQHVVNIIVFMD